MKIMKMKMIVLGVTLLVSVASAQTGEWWVDFDDGGGGGPLSSWQSGYFNNRADHSLGGWIIRDDNLVAGGPLFNGNGELYTDGGNGFRSRADFPLAPGGNFRWDFEVRPYNAGNSLLKMAINTSDDSAPSNGSLVLKIGSLPAGNSHDGLSWEVVGDVGSTGGAAIDFLADMGPGNDGTPENNQMRLVFEVTGGNSLEIWKQVIQDTDTPANLDAALVSVGTFNIGNTMSIDPGNFLSFTTTSGQMQLNDVHYTVTPEPATMLLLACGLGVLARRKRTC